MLKIIAGRLGVALVAMALMALPALADDWVATKLRGSVLRLVEGDWVRLKRGDVVSNQDVIRTLADGRVQFTRDQETVDLDPDTQIQIFDRTDQRFTTVKQYFGAVSVMANVENVQHFEVDTPYLAAVVKGTKFKVTSGATGATVAVTRGQVAVEDNAEHHVVLLSVGQRAAATGDGDLTVSGKGALPAILDGAGTIVPNGDVVVAEGSEEGVPILSVPLDEPVSHGSHPGKDGGSQGHGSSGGGGNDGSGGGGHGGHHGLLGGLLGGLV